MATATRKLFVNIRDKVLQISDVNGGAFVLPDFIKYENVPFEIILVEPDLASAGLPKWSRVDISNLSIAISLNDTLDDTSPLAYQSTFAKDEDKNILAGSLNVNTSSMNTFIGSNSQVACYFEIEIQEGSNVIKAYQTSVTVKNAVAQIGAAVPTPTDTYLTTAQADAQYPRKVMKPGEQFTITSPSNTYQRIFGVDDGGNAIDQIVPVVP